MKWIVLTLSTFRVHELESVVDRNATDWLIGYLDRSTKTQLNNLVLQQTVLDGTRRYLY